MADLKLGTTLGGAGIWSASNLPLMPSGGQITYKGWRIYTENDRPTAEDIGALSLANGGTVNNDTTFTKNVTVGVNLTANVLLSKSSIDISRQGNGASLFFRRPDISGTPATEQAILYIESSTASGIVASTFNVNARADGGNKVYITAYKSGLQNTVLSLDSQAQQVTVEQGVFRVLGNTVLAGATATSMAVSGALTANTVTPTNWSNHDVRYMTGIPRNMTGLILSAAEVTEKNDILSVSGNITDGPYGNTTYNGQVLNFRRSSNSGNALTQFYFGNGLFHIRSGSGSPGAWSWVGGDANGWRKIYDENNKPTPAEIGALKNTTDTLNGSLTINSGATSLGLSITSTTGQSEYRFASGSNTGNIGISPADVYIGNLTSGKYIQMTHTGALNYSGAKIYRSDDKPTPREIGTATTTTTSLSGGATGIWTKIGTATVQQSATSMSIRITGGAGYNAETGQAQYADIIIRSNNGASKAIGVSLFRSGGTSPNEVGYIYTSGDEYDIYVKCGAYQQGVALTWDGTGGTNFVHNVVIGTTTPPVGLVPGTVYTILNSKESAEITGVMKFVGSGYLQLGGSTNNIRGIYGDVILRDWNNGNTTVCASRTSASASTGGDLYLGYNDPGNGCYTSNIRLRVPTYVDSSFTCINSMYVGNSRKIRIDSSNTSTQNVMMSLWGNTVGRNTVLEFSDDTSWWMYCQRTSNGSVEFMVNGNGNFNDVYIRSDEKLKSNFTKIENALDKVDSLDGCLYDKHSYIGSENTSREAGIIAQQLQKVLPEAVKKSVDEKENEILTISPTATIALLVNAIKELREEVRELKSRI